MQNNYYLNHKSGRQTTATTCDKMIATKRTDRAKYIFIKLILITAMTLNGCSDKPQTMIAEKPQLASLNINCSADSLLISGNVKASEGMCFEKLNVEYIDDRKLQVLIFLRQTKEKTDRVTSFSATIPLKHVNEVLFGKSKTLLWESPTGINAQSGDLPPSPINYNQLYHFIRSCYTCADDHFYIAEYEWQPQADSSIAIYDWHERDKVATIKNNQVYPATTEKRQANLLKNYIRMQAEALHRFFRKPYRIFPSQAIRYREKVFGECGLGEEDLLVLDKLLQSGVDQFNKDEANRKGQSARDVHAVQEVFLQRYRRQYVPYINEEGKKMAWVACYDVTINGGSEMKKLCRLGEGGNNYFNVTINLTDKRVEAMVINKY